MVDQRGTGSSHALPCELHEKGASLAERLKSNPFKPELFRQYAGALRGISRRQLSPRADALIDLLEMGDIVNRRAEGFSQGERVKVALSRAT